MIRFHVWTMRLLQVTILILTSAACSPARDTTQPTILSAEPTKRVTPEASETPATTIALQHHYLPEFKLTLGYPETWEVVSDYEFRGDDGALIVSELAQYRSRDPIFVRNDYVFHLIESTGIGFDNFTFTWSFSADNPWVRCSIETPTEQKHVTVFPIAWGEKGIRYISIRYETQKKPKIGFDSILDAVTLNEQFHAPESNDASPPDPGVVSLPNGITITETYLHKAEPRGLDWDGYGSSIFGYPYFDDCVFKVDNMVLTDDLNYSTWKRMRVLLVRTEIKYCEWDRHWIFEDNGYIFMDGVILNQVLGYEDMFDWGLLSGKPFFFYSSDGLTYLSFDGETLPVAYDYVHHYGCCEGPRSANPGFTDTRVVFNGVRDGNWYLVKVTVPNER